MDALQIPLLHQPDDLQMPMWPSEADTLRERLAELDAALAVDINDNDGLTLADWLTVTADLFQLEKEDQ